MSFVIPPPNPPSSVDYEDFECFVESYSNWESATTLSTKADNIRVSTFLAICGQTIFGIYRSLNLLNTECDTLQKIILAIKKKIKPKTNIIYERYVFNSLTQNDDEAVENFVVRLKKAVKSCGYKELEGELLRDRLVVGIKDDMLRRRLLVKDNLDWNDAVSICVIQETTDAQIKEFASKKVEDVFSLRSSNRNGNLSRYNNDGNYNNNNNRNCNSCGYKHESNRCLAYGKQCYKCNKLNHFASKCRAGYSRSPRRIQTIESDEHIADDYEEMPIATFESISSVNDSTMQQRKGNSKILTTNLRISADDDHIGKKAKSTIFQMDTGASCNVMSLSKYKELTNLNGEQLERSTVILKAFGNNLVKPLGTGILRCHTSNRKYRLLFQLIDFDILPLLSFNTCQSLNLITINPVNSLIPLESYRKTADEIIEKWKNVFEGQGKLDGSVHLELKPNAIPSSETPRRVPEALREQLRLELDRMEKEDIIEKVDYHTDYISNLVIVKKAENKLRICLDPFKLNKDLQRCDYQIPKLEEILPSLAKARVFTKLDAKNGYWQLELSTESQKLTAFWTPFGRYVFKRLAFGLKPASEIYQQRQHEIVDGLEGVQVIHDDIIVYGRGDDDESAWKDHNCNLERVLSKLSSVRLKLNKNKTIVGESEIPFFGHVLTKFGLKADSEKIRAIKEMKTPTDSKGVQRFVGVINYLSKFLPRLSLELEPIRKLIHDPQFIWTNAHDELFIRLKELVTCAPVLSYFDLTIETTIQCDASSTGLGAVLMQKGKPVYYASRALTPTETKYAQIEKECLAIVFSCKKFDQYICGNNKVTIETDHKPLITVFNREICKAPRRLQRMMLELQRYTFTLIYKKGSEVILADALSRAYVEENIKDDNNYLQVYLCDEKDDVFEQIEKINMLDNIDSDELSTMRTATANDPELCKVMQAVSSGWKADKQKEDQEIRKYWNYRDQLTLQDGLLIKGEKLVVPEKMIASVIDKLHYGHIGMESCIKKARDTLFWNGMNDDIRNIIKKCYVCAQNGASQRRLPMQVHDIPVYPFQRVGIDLCEVKKDNGEKINMLVTSDYYSDYFEVDFLKSTTADLIIECCKRNFARHGIPAFVISDNGPQFISNEFGLFSKIYQFRHSTCSPYHHLGNSKAESAVKIVEEIYTKAKASKRDFWLALLEHRNTPNTIGSSPVQRLMSRRTRALVPIMTNNLQPKVEEDVRDKIIQRKQQIKQQYDKGSRDLPELQIGQSVFMQRRPDRIEVGWEPGVVKDKLSSRSYNIEVNGRVYRRNRQHIKKNPNPFSRPIPKSQSVTEHNFICKRVRFSEKENTVQKTFSRNNCNFYIDQVNSGEPVDADAQGQSNEEVAVQQSDTLSQQIVNSDEPAAADIQGQSSEEVEVKQSDTSSQQIMNSEEPVAATSTQQNVIVTQSSISERTPAGNQRELLQPNPQKGSSRPSRHKQMPGHLKEFILDFD